MAKQGRSESSMDQKRKSALISMSAATTGAPIKTVSLDEQPPSTVRRMSSQKSAEEQPNLVRVVSSDDTLSLDDNEAAPADSSGSFHNDLSRLGNAIRSLSLVQAAPSTIAETEDQQPKESTATQNPFDHEAVAPKQSKEKYGELQPFQEHSRSIRSMSTRKLVDNPNRNDHLLRTASTHQLLNRPSSISRQARVLSAPIKEGTAVAQNPFEAAAAPKPEETNKAIQNPFDGPPEGEGPAPRGTGQNPFDDTKPPEREDAAHRRASQNPFDQAAAAMVEPAATAVPNANPFEDPSLFTTNNLQVPLDGEKVPMTRHEHHNLDVPLDGERVLMPSSFQDHHQVPVEGHKTHTRAHSLHSSFQEHHRVRLDGHRPPPSFHSSFQEQHHVTLDGQQSFHSSFQHAHSFPEDVPLDGQRVLMSSHSFQENNNLHVPLDGRKVLMSPSQDLGHETSDDEDSDDEDEEDGALHAVTPTATTDDFSFC